MSNKYTWVFFNLIASVGLLAWTFTGISDVNESTTKGSGEILLIIIAGSIYWIYRTIKTWQLCIRADDPNFDKALAEQESKE